MAKREILEQAFKEIFDDDWANELRDFEHGFSDFYDATIRAMELISERQQSENQQKKPDTKQLNIAGVVGQSEQLVCCECCIHFDIKNMICSETCINWNAFKRAN